MKDNKNSNKTEVDDGGSGYREEKDASREKN
jgi:hypothetical protein